MTPWSFRCSPTDRSCRIDGTNNSTARLHRRSTGAPRGVLVDDVDAAGLQTPCPGRSHVRGRRAGMVGDNDLERGRGHNVTAREDNAAGAIDGGGAAVDDRPDCHSTGRSGAITARGVMAARAWASGCSAIQAFACVGVAVRCRSQAPGIRIAGGVDDDDDAVEAPRTVRMTRSRQVCAKKPVL